MKSRLIYCLLILGLSVVSVTGQESDTSMVLIPGGEFMMGKDSDRGFNFSPAHKVKVDSFFMDIHEVTNAEYLRFCQETGYKLPEFWNTDRFNSGEDYMNYPVIGVNWFDACKYAEWAGKRLPTEAEWEYAARGGLIDNEYPNGNTWTKARAKQDSTGWQNLTEPVGMYEPNAYGLFDMGGNVWEWTNDSYSEDYYEESETDNPKGPEKGSNRVIRSGSWHSGAMCKKVYFRKGLPGNWCDFAVGFRCVRD